MQNNPVVFVSLGPGEPELITVKGLRILQQADIILCPATITKNGTVSSRAADIMLPLEIANDKIQLFPVPMSKDRSKALNVYGEICKAAMDHYKAARRVVVVAEGDAGFYSSIHYVYDKLHEVGIPVSSIPGIPAFIASGAIAGLHIVQQEERLMVIPGNTTAEELYQLLAGEITVVIMKLSQCVDELHAFIGDHPTYHYHYFENIGTENEYYSSNREELAEKAFPYFSLMIIRK